MNASAPTTLDYLKALASFAIPATVFLVIVGAIFVVSAIRFKWFEVDVEFGKLKLHIRKPKLDSVAAPTPIALAAVESLPPEPPTEIVAIATPPSDQGESGESEPSPLEYIRARSVDDLDRTYPAFREKISSDHLEFWETDYRRRRALYGADHGRDGVRQLILEHPTWAYPHAVLLEWSLEDRDFDAALEHLASGLMQQGSPQFAYVLSAGVKLQYELYGAGRARDFCIEWSKASIPERMKSDACYALAE